MITTGKAPLDISGSVENAANSVALKSDGFQVLGEDHGLVMGTPGFLTTTALLTAATITQWTTAVGGAIDNEISLDQQTGDDTPSIHDLIRLYES
ncbi:hypothetical protein GCM10009720_08990 [Yaniella flava]|uniref:Uncharacterized protein n=1 Tax=Yaniella flava TaxID=287930 RepID=A0ABP5FR88_9MICC